MNLFFFCYKKQKASSSWPENTISSPSAHLASFGSLKDIKPRTPVSDQEGRSVTRHPSSLNIASMHWFCLRQTPSRVVHHGLHPPSSATPKDRERLPPIIPAPILKLSLAQRRSHAHLWTNPRCQGMEYADWQLGSYAQPRVRWGWGHQPCLNLRDWAGAT